MKNLEILLAVLGWQGGTVHQVARTLGLNAFQIINANRKDMQEYCREAEKIRNKEQKNDNKICLVG
jgi:hypothetical protein